MELEFRNWGKGKIELLTQYVRTPRLLTAFALHFKEDGTITEEPSLCFECKDGELNVYAHEISIKTLTLALAKAGYRLTRLTPVENANGAGAESN